MLRPATKPSLCVGLPLPGNNYQPQKSRALSRSFAAAHGAVYPRPLRQISAWPTPQFAARSPVEDSASFPSLCADKIGAGSAPMRRLRPSLLLYDCSTIDSSDLRRFGGRTATPHPRNSPRWPGRHADVLRDLRLLGFDGIEASAVSADGKGESPVVVCLY